MCSAIFIVPQSPDFFEGTPRENIDPVGEYLDVDIRIALDQFLASSLMISDSDLINYVETKLDSGCR